MSDSEFERFLDRCKLAHVGTLSDVIREAVHGWMVHGGAEMYAGDPDCEMRARIGKLDQRIEELAAELEKKVAGR